MKNLDERLLKKLEDYKKKLYEVEQFAKKIPVFADQIIDRELTDDSENDFGSTYKDIYLAWGIKRWKYYNVERGCLPEPLNGSYFEIYVNICSLFGDYFNLGVEEAVKPYYAYYDKVNSTFYIEDKDIENALEALNKWYLEAKPKAVELKKEIEIAKLEKKINELKGSD